MIAESRTGTWVAALMLASSLIVVGCKSDAPAAKPDPGSTAKATPGEAQPAAPEGKAPAAEGAKAGAKAPEEADPGAPPEKVEAPRDKETLAKAYVEIYCAQRKKETDRLLEIYTRYGFEDPKTWTASWTEAAKDDAWVAEITQKAIQACP